MSATVTEARIVFVRRRMPTPQSLDPQVLAGLRSRGAQVEYVRMWLSGPELPWAAFDHADLIALRGVAPATVLRIAACAPPGAVWCNRPAATAVAADRLESWRRLAAAGVPVPTGRVAHEPAEVEALAARGPVVVKTPLGSRGDGVTPLEQGTVWAGDGPGPWLVQTRVSGDGWDRKLYVIGPRVHGRLRPWPLRSPEDRIGRPLHLDSELEELARTVGAVLGLCAYGVDVIAGPDGPVVIDVNAFPGFKGVPGAAGLLVDHLLDHLEGSVRTCAY
jgi:ribosomal protein S6--L-glutamate ligase